MLAILEFFAQVYTDILLWFQNPASTNSRTTAPLFFYNTLAGKKQEFTTSVSREVKMYNCGPTVYGPQHIGNLSMFVFVDILRRTLEFNNYKVSQVINFTDVGHLSGDNDGNADEGEDRMTKGLKREGMALTLENMRALGKRYADLFLEDLARLNINTAGTKFPRASDYISEQIKMVQTLEEKGYAYRGSAGVYFDTSKFPEYGALGNIDLAGLRAGARVSASSDKRNPTDFLLWKFSGAGRVQKASDSRRGDGGARDVSAHTSIAAQGPRNAEDEPSGHVLGWDSPWGFGYPGWHIECSAMSRTLLGDQLDIHTGGIEHIPIHHNNEIAQSECATGKKPFSRFWLHRAHLQIEGAKIAKSIGNTIYVSDIAEQGFPPLAFRYLLLGAHYRTSASFSWENLKAAQTSLYRLYNYYDTFRENAKNGVSGNAARYLARFRERINDDLDTPGALAVVWEMTKDEDVSASEKLLALKEFDSVLGLQMESGSAGQKVTADELPSEIQELLEKREAARKTKEWAKADDFRKEIENAGYTLEDSSNGPKILKK